MRYFDVPMPFDGEVLRVIITVKEFEKPDASGHRLYTVKAIEIEKTPALLGDAVSRASSGLSDRAPTSDAGVEARFAQMAAIVKGELDPDSAMPQEPPPVFSRSSAAVVNPAAPSRFPSFAPFRARMDSVIDSLIYNFQDRFKPLKDIQKRAGIVPEEEDAALAEERYSGTVRARIDEFEASMRDSLIKGLICFRKTGPDRK
jgi:hypothetical protein